MKKFLALLLIILIFSGCTETEITDTPAITPVITPDNNEFGKIIGVITSADLKAKEPYVEIQWTNTFNNAVTIKEIGTIKILINDIWHKAGTIKKPASPVENVTLDAYTTLKPIRYNLINFVSSGSGKYVISFDSVDNTEVSATADLFFSEKEVKVEVTPEITPYPNTLTTPKPKNYLGTAACEVDTEKTKPFTEVPQKDDEKVKIKIITISGFALAYYPGAEKATLESIDLTVRINNTTYDDIIVRSVCFEKDDRQLNNVDSLDANNYENIIKGNCAADVKIKHIIFPLTSGTYKIVVKYTVGGVDYHNLKSAELKVKIPEKYAGNNFPIPGRINETGKPIIYLYPETETEVKVELAYDGLLKYTYPRYNNGWHVLAKPDGTLINYQDNLEYSYLFWEGYDNLKCDYSKGFCVKGEETSAFLQQILSKIGLTPKEYNEFIVYWLPKMQDNPYNIISFQFENYCEMAKLRISPEPDSLLRVFMAYKPSETFIELEPQEFSKFERNGFTVVEWGGKRSE